MDSRGQPNDEVRQRRSVFQDETRRVAEYESISQYGEAVREWVAQCKHLCDLQTQAHLAFQATTAHMNDFGNRGPTMPHTQFVTGNTVIQAFRGYRIVSGHFRPASFSRRIIAEIIDFFLFFMMKLMILLLFIDLDIVDLEKYEKLLGNQADLQTLIDVTQDLFPLELMGKLFASLIECAFISFGFSRYPPGATPGKLMMRIKVISARNVVSDGQPGQVIVTGFETVPVMQSLLRALLKNYFINSFFPLSSIAFAFHNNRSAYDMLSQTIVVRA